jgi:nucleotide-binding universal stress UspA family protein
MKLIIVGGRRIRVRRRAALGSVSHQCAQHATVPVAIVRPTE